MKCLFLTVIFGTVAVISAQYDSPAPPRLNIPGAVPLPILRPGGGNGIPASAFRTDRVHPGPVVIRTRRPLIKGGRLQPNGVPAVAALEPAKPVTEQPEEDEAPFAPQILHSAPHQPQLLAHAAPQPKLLAQTNFFEPNSLGEDEAGPIIARFQPQERPTAVPVQLARFQQQPQQQQHVQHQQQQQQYKRPAFRNPEPEEQQQQQQRREPVVRPTPRLHSHHQDERERKPVAQILRKYREEHEDGTITWGFENDDGSFKEESIGIDCVTRGRYGYVDPDGNKREYSYETGNLCDPNKRDQEESDEELEPEYVAPQVKHLKRPQPQFRN